MSGLKIIDISGELAKHSKKHYKKRELSSIKCIVLHHGAALGDGKEKLLAYARYYVRTRDWPGIAYHFGIGQDGTIYQTNPLDLVTFHVGRYNPQAVGIVLVGHFDLEEVKEPQMASAVSLCAHLCKTLDIPWSKVKGHREFPGVLKTCPGTKIDMDKFRTKVKEALEGEKPKEIPPSQARVVFEGKEIKALVIEGRTYAQVREIAQLLGLKVRWEKETKTIVLSKP